MMMSTVVLDAFERDNPIGNTLHRLLEEKGDTPSCFRLKDMNIHPCRSCGACGFKSPGKCIIDDDIHGIMRGIAKSKTYIMLTPVSFGGYSAQLKKVVDRMMPMGMPYYIVKDGHMLHPMRYGDKSLIVIGLAEENLQGQDENFRLLVARNAMNMMFSCHKTLIFKPSDSMTIIESGIGNTLREVEQR
jgi:multimeric flavodoxin WrbA